jgi:hypothetical protein
MDNVLNFTKNLNSVALVHELYRPSDRRQNFTSHIIKPSSQTYRSY